MKKTFEKKNLISALMESFEQDAEQSLSILMISNRDVNGRWAEWAIAHPHFGRIEMRWWERRGGAPHYYLLT